MLWYSRNCGRGQIKFRKIDECTTIRLTLMWIKKTAPQTVHKKCIRVERSGHLKPLRSSKIFLEYKKIINLKEAPQIWVRYGRNPKKTFLQSRFEQSGQNDPLFDYADTCWLWLQKTCWKYLYHKYRRRDSLETLCCCDQGDARKTIKVHGINRGHA